MGVQRESAALIEVGGAPRAREDKRSMCAVAEHAASKGSACAMTYLARVLAREGRQEEAEGWWERAAEAGSVPAKKERAYLLLKSGRGEEAVGLFEELAVPPNYACMNTFGAELLNGDFVPKDEKRAAEMFLAAAEGGMVRGMLNYATCARRGIGMAKDHAASYKWCMRAAELDSAEAHEMVGWHLFKGKGVSRDMSGSVYYLRIAASHGFSLATFLYAEVLRRSIPKVCSSKETSDIASELREEAIRNYEKAYASGNVDAYKRLTLMVQSRPESRRDSLLARTQLRAALRAGAREEE